MTIRTQEAMQAQIDSLLASNTSGSISESDCRSVFQDLVDTAESRWTVLDGDAVDTLITAFADNTSGDRTPAEVRAILSGISDVVFELIPSEITDPTDLSGLAMWLDGADASSMDQVAGSQPWGSSTGTPPVVTNDLVLHWADKSGNNRHVNQSNASAAPVYNTPNDGQNSNSVVEFNISGVDDQLYSTSAFLTDPRQCTVLYVANSMTDGYNGTVFSNTNTSTLRLACMVDSVTAQGWMTWIVDATGGSTIAHSSDDLGTEYNQFTVFTDSANINGRLNGVDKGLTPRPFAGDGVTANDYTRIGMQYSDTRPMEGHVAELVIYDRKLLSAEITLVEAYLKAKWDTP